MVNRLEGNTSGMEKRYRSVEELNILDDFLFTELMMNEEHGQEFVEYFLKTILNTDVIVNELRAQEIHSGGDPNNKGIRMDVLIEGEILSDIKYQGQNQEQNLDQQKNQEVTIDVEMQNRSNEVKKGKRNDLRRRSRVYQAYRDVKMLKSGEKYGDLKNILIIICTPFDVFGRDRMKYTFVNQCLEEPDLQLEDGAVRIFLYTKGKKGSTKEMAEMLKYVEKSVEENAVSAELKNMHRMVLSVKQNKEVGARYMWMIEHEMELREEGIEKGKMLNMISQICKKIVKNKSKEQIVEEMEEEPDFIQMIYEIAVKHKPEYEVNEIYEAVEKRLSH